MNPRPPRDKSRWTLPATLLAQVESRPSDIFLRSDDGRQWTYAETLTAARTLSGGLAALGVQPEDRVVLMMDNSPETILLWFGINLLGATEVPINTAHRGESLIHVLNNSGAQVIVAHAGHLPTIEAVLDRLEHVRHVVSTPGDGPTSGLNPVPWSDLSQAPPLEELPDVDYRDIGAIMYTSGTTGPAKGVLMPHAHMYHFANQVVEQLRLSSEDVFYVCLPLFHANAQLMQVYATLISGGRVELASRFSATEWLTDVRQRGATVSSLLGVMAQFIFAQPERTDDRETQLTRMVTIPLPREIAAAFEERFAVTCVEAYGMTEICLPLYRNIDEPLRPGSCGRVLSDEFEVRVVDPETDEPLPPGEVGEIVVRPLLAYTTFAGYHQMPERTVEAWRNLWFHTGDSGSYDEEGYFYFADRTADRIRRRGENVTAYDIELVLASHPGVVEAAVVGVPAAEGEDEIKAFLVTSGSIDHCEIIRRCADRLPYFCVPRYLEVIDQLPKTASAKVLKRELRTRPPQAEWDREQAGMRMTRQGLVEHRP